MRINTAWWETIREPCAVVKIARVDEQEVYVLLECDLLHVRHERRKVSTNGLTEKLGNCRRLRNVLQVPTVVGLWKGRLLVPEQPTWRYPS